MFHRPVFGPPVLAAIFLLIAKPHAAVGQSGEKPNLPTDVQGTNFLNKYCSDCHTGDHAEGEFRFSASAAIPWTEPRTAEAWEQVEVMVRRRMMPSPEADQPSAEEREQFLFWLDHRLMEHGRLGGTVLRRLSRREYGNTIRSVFGFRQFEVSDDFPPDSTFDGFDNHGQSLVTAPGHLESLVTHAVAVADRLYPPKRPTAKFRRVHLSSDDLVISYSSAFKVDGAMRLGSSGANFRRNATWPSRFEAPVRGVYRIHVKAHAVNAPAEHQPEIRLGSMKDNSSVNSNIDQQPLPQSDDQTVSFQATLDRGQSFSLLYANGAFRYDDKKELAVFLKDFLATRPDIAAAWDRVGNPARGGNGWKQVQQEIAKGDLPLPDYKRDSKKLLNLIKRMSSKNVNTGETLVYHFFENGPAVAIQEVIVEGPLEVLPDAQQIREQQERERILKDWHGRSGSIDTEAGMQILLSKLFRRPATLEEVKRYSQLVEDESARTQSAEEGWHLAIRTALISPAFLYRNITEPHDINHHHVATRLAYFLTSGPPGDHLTQLATDGKLQNLDILRQEARRLLGQQFIEDFCRQWLHLSTLDSLMPDARLMAEFTDEHREAMVEEVYRTFTFVLKENRPVIDLIAPDFVLANSLLAKDIYQLESPEFGNKTKRNRWVRVSVPRDGRHGGLICMAAISMATANGVDTQPVLRGVWMLENILGSPPPEPPDAVPALTPDTSAAITVKERLAAHMSDASCATCHREIDPVGFALENFDPVGRFRSHYPIYETVRKGNRSRTVVRNGPLVDATGALPDGTVLQDVTDLKVWLKDHPRQFAECLSHKLMTYATGRKLSYREKQILNDIVEELHESDELRMQNLLQALITSEVFLTP